MADTAITTTLRHVLTQRKPCVPCKINTLRNTKSKEWPSVEKNTVTVWTDFNLDTLNESYGHILDHDVFTAQLADVPLAETVLNSVEIVKPNDMLYLIDWNNRMLGPTLEFAKECLGLHPGVPLRLTTLSRDKKKPIARVSDGRRNIKVDHRIELNCYPLPDLVVGLGRPSFKFPARQIANKPEFASLEVLWPLRQLAHMCDIAGTRYGYIMTEEDFVACCFHKPVTKPAESAPQADSLTLNVALMPVPWEQYGKEQLTTDLALWWLSMLALSDSGHRALVPKADMVGIGEWETAFFDEERGWVHRHRYSKFEERTGQPPPPAYQTPSPGNQAAFEAAVGISIDPNFDLYDGDFGIYGHVDGAGVVDGPFFGHPDPLDELNVAENIADVYAAN